MISLTRRAGIVEPLHVRSIRLLLYGVSMVIYLLPLASWTGIGVTVMLTLLGLPLATVAHRRAMRLPAALVMSLVTILLALQLGGWIVDSALAASLLGIHGALALAEGISFGLVALSVAFLLRMLSLVSRPLSLLEVLFVAGSVVALLADHRNRMINRPRFFSDWAWSLGINPTTVLVVIGIVATLAAILLLLRGQRLTKLLTGLVLMLLLGGAFYMLWNRRIESSTSPDPLGLAGKGGAKGDPGDGGRSDDPFKDDYSSSGQPSPVAIAILQDDLETSSQILYFRQKELSLYNGHHLVSGQAQGWDRDVITELPRSGSLRAQRAQIPENHVELPTTMFLLVDHPQPPALTHADRITLVPNPNPQQFVAAYEVDSLTLAVQSHRLFGRPSVPATWTADQRSHYTALPDDPRYRALADIIVTRDVDPRFFADKLAQAYAIKRYLEREGFYTMRSKHSSGTDPAASFLFGSLRGYCVHFAHAAVYLMRSLGIAARVALGYAVQINKRSGGSAILIMSDRAHAWPEVHLEGIGWVTLDIYPQRTDLPPPMPVDVDLEKLLGELARNDPTAGVTPDRTTLKLPWMALLKGVGLTVVCLLLLAYLIKTYRRLIPRLRRGRAYPRLAYIAVLDLLSDLGQPRRRGETRERHAARLAQRTPHLQELTRVHLALALGGGRAWGDNERFARMVDRVQQDLRQSVHPVRRVLGLINPIGWLWTR